MILSKLIAALEQQIASHGDLVAAIHDADPDYHLGIDRVEYDARTHLVIIGGDYNTEATRVIDEALRRLGG